MWPVRGRTATNKTAGGVGASLRGRQQGSEAGSTAGKRQAARQRRGRQHSKEAAAEESEESLCFFLWTADE